MAGLLDLVQRRVADRIGIPRPTTLVNSTQKDARQLLAIATKVAEDLADIDWPILLKFVTFTSVATQFQKDLPDIAPDLPGDNPRVIGETLWNFSNAVFTVGPLSAQEWQFQQVRAAAAPYQRFQLRLNPATGNMALYYDVAPTAGQTHGFAYYSANWAKPAGASPTLASAFAADTDGTLWPDKLIAQGIIAYWKREKGLAYQEDMADYEEDRDSMLAQQRATSVTNLVPASNQMFIGPENLAEGNWPEGS